MNNLKSLNRRLHDTLVFVCNHKFGKDDLMLLPQGKWREGETLRQTAERTTSEMCGSNLKLHFYGNAPIGFYKYKYPVSERKDTIGAKVFFFRAVYKTGDIDNQKLKYEWITNAELRDKVNSSYYEVVNSFCC